jgi:hypothetical protein
MPRPGAICGSSRPVSIVRAPISVGTLVFDEARITPFLHSVAYAEALERHVKLKMETYDKSTVLNIIYTVFWWKGKPVTFDVDLGDQKVLEAEAANGSEKLLEMFVTRASRGPDSVVSFLKSQEDARRRCLETVSAVFQEVRELTNEVISETKRGIDKLAVIKASATIAFKAMGVAATGPLAFLVDMGYDISLSIIKDWDKAGEAKVIGVITEASKDSGQEVVEDGAEEMEKILKSEGAGPAKQSKWLQKRVAQMEEELTKKSRSDLLRKFGRDSRRLARAKSAASHARWGARVMSSVKFLFLAKDVYEAVDEARETIHQAGE